MSDASLKISLVVSFKAKNTLKMRSSNYLPRRKVLSTYPGEKETASYKYLYTKAHRSVIPKSYIWKQRKPCGQANG